MIPRQSPRKCPECGELHDLILEDIKTGEIVEVFEKCRGCLLGFGPKGHLRNGFPARQEQITIQMQHDGKVSIKE